MVRSRKTLKAKFTAPGRFRQKPPVDPVVPKSIPLDLKKAVQTHIDNGVRLKVTENSIFGGGREISLWKWKEKEEHRIGLKIAIVERMLKPNNYTYDKNSGWWKR